MKRKIEYKISDGGRVSPSTRQWGGMQYEDNATELVFDISDTEVKKEGILWRIDFNSSAAGYNPSETLAVEGGKVKRLLPYDMTRCGGEIQVTLIGTEVDLEGQELSIAYSIPVTVYLTDVEQHEESAKEMAPRISAAEASAVDAAKRAKQSEEFAAESAQIAEQAKSVTEEARFALEEGATFVFQGGDATSENEVDLVVDSALSKVSENPVQNKAVTLKLNELEQKGAELEQDIKAVQNTADKNRQSIEAVQVDIDRIEDTIHIVESGTSGMWTYRVWSDGTAECWGRTMSITTPEWDNMSVACNVDLPFEFIGYPTVTCSGHQHATHSSYVAMAVAFSTYVSAYIKCAHAPDNEYFCWFNFHIIGKRG